MLRKLVLAAGIGCLAAGAALLAFGLHAGIVLLIWGVLLVCGVAFERIRYKPLQPGTPGPGWQRTSERFIDDATGAEVVVYVRPSTGERAYVRDGKTIPAPR